ncbi:Uncharacterized protein DAT39_022578, partial [Clarias magur]
VIDLSDSLAHSLSHSLGRIYFEQLLCNLQSCQTQELKVIPELILMSPVVDYGFFEFEAEVDVQIP